MKPIKFLIVDDKIRMGAVSYHRYLLTPDDKFAIIKGGGMVEFEYNDNNKTIRFDSGSADYGTFKQSDVKDAIANTKDFDNSLETIGKIVCGDNFDLSKCRIFAREEEIKL